MLKKKTEEKKVIACLYLFHNYLPSTAVVVVCCCFVIINSNNFNFSPSSFLIPILPAIFFSFPPTTHNSAATRNDCRFSLHRHRRRCRYSSYTHSPCPPTEQQKTSTSHLTPPPLCSKCWPPHTWIERKFEKILNFSPSHIHREFSRGLHMQSGRVCLRQLMKFHP